MSSGEESSPAAEEQVKYKGVRKRKWGKYVTEIRLSNSRERIWLGSYDTAEKAARAFDAALLCLRGPHAKFNFPDDPPSFAAAPGMSPAEIQSIAQQYANRFPTHRAEEEEEKAENSKETMDWSFLGDFDLGKRSGISGISDFELFHDPEGMNTPTYFGLPHYRNYDDTDDE